MPLSNASLFERGYWLGYRILRTTLALLGYGLAVGDTALRRFLGLGFLPQPWESLARFRPVSPGLPSNRVQKVWVHAASLGEAAGVLALLGRLPIPTSHATEWILTAQTAAGLVRLRDAAPNLQDLGPISVAVAPFDHPKTASLFLKVHAITQVMLYESELWPSWIASARAADISVYWVAARCSSRAYALWSRFPAIAAHVLAGLSWVQVRSEADGQRLQSFYTGPSDLGVDGKSLVLPPHPISLPTSEMRGLALYCVHRSEWQQIKPYLHEVMASGPVVVIPRYAHEFEFFRRELVPFGFCFHSKKDPHQRQLIPHQKTPKPSECILVDALGVASYYLELCQTAFVGGSLGRTGGHAFWEPLRLGLFLVAGPFLANQEPTASDLIAAGLLKVWQGENLLALLQDAPQPQAHILALKRFWSEQQAHQERAIQDLSTVLFRKGQLG